MHRPNNSERFAFERMARTNNRDSLRKVLMIGSVSYVPCSRGCLSCGPGTSARRDHRSSVPAGSDGRESCEPRLCRFGCGTPRRSVVRFADSPSWDYVASFRRPHGRVLRSVLSGRASEGISAKIACGTFACSWLCEGPAVSKASEGLRNGTGELDAPRVPSSRQECGPARIDWGIFAG